MVIITSSKIRPLVEAAWNAPHTGEVEIEVHASGLNFSDVLKALGLYPGIKDEIVPLGIECSGIVTACGSVSGWWARSACWQAGGI